MTTELVAELEAQAAALTMRVATEMYRDPFWQARFGDRGRKFTEEDGRHHVSYLVQALVAQDVEVLARYARWLRSVLTTRGMCTRHLAENFARLARAVRELSADAQPAVTYLQAAQQALYEEVGSAQPLLRASDRLAEQVCAQLAQPAASSRCPTSTAAELLRPVRPRPELPQQVASLVSYLADALALDDGKYLLAHVRWLEPWLQEQFTGWGSPGRGLTAQLLSGLGQCLAADESIPSQLRARAGALLREGLALLAAEPGVGARAS